MEDLTAIALRLWERAGQRPLPPADLEGILVFQFHWFKPSEAASAVRALREHGLLRPVPPGDRLELDAALKGLAVPVAYRPPEDFRLPPERAPLEERVLGSLARASAGTLEELSGEVERCVLRTGVSRPVAALLVARARGVELPDLAREAEAELRRGPRPGLPPLSPSQTT